MMSLLKTSGLPIELREDYALVFGAGMNSVQPRIRDFSSFKNYLKDPFSTIDRRDVYHVYPDVALSDDAPAIAAAGLQYDILVIPPGKLGDEFAKTAGHYPSVKPGSQTRYPEIHEVIYGEVYWILQSASDDLERLEKVIAVAGSRGTKLIVPPGFGIVSVNPTDKLAVLTDWRVRGSKLLEEPYEIHNGAAYYVIQTERLTKSGGTAADSEFAPNLHYNLLPPLQHAVPREAPQYDLRTALPMYFTAVKNPAALDFLLNPEKYPTELTLDKLFTFENK